MAELKVSGRMSVKKLKENFKNEFGGTLRVYDGREKADDNATLASIRRDDDAKGGELICQGNRTVGRFEREMLEVFGIKVQVATPDDYTLALDGITLASLKSIPEKCSKADMESLVAYKRKANQNNEGECSADDDSSSNVVRLTLIPNTAFRLSLFPVFGDESNEMIDENGFDLDVLNDLEDLYTESTGREYDIVVNFYSSEDGAEYIIDGGDTETLYLDTVELDASTLRIDLGIADEDEDDLSDDYILTENLKMGGEHSSDSKEIFNDIINRHKEGYDDDHVDVIVNAVQRRMKQVAEQLVNEGLVDDVDSVRFGLKYGMLSGAFYSTIIRTDEFDPEKLRVLDCCDWNDCRNIPEVLQEHWPDRLLNNIVYGDKFYELECNQIDSYDFNFDLVHYDLRSVEYL